MQKPKRGERTSKHVSKKEAHAGMANMMHSKVSKTQAAKEKKNKTAKYR